MRQGFSIEVCVLAAACAAWAAPRQENPLLGESRLEAVHAQRIEWMKHRAPMGDPPGIYQDYRAVILRRAEPSAKLLKAASEAGVKAIIAPGLTDPAGQSVLLLAPPAEESHWLDLSRKDANTPADWRKLRGKWKQYPEEVLGAESGLDSKAVAAWDRENASGHASAFVSTEMPPGVPDAAAFGGASTHILARELAEASLEESLAQGHSYLAFDWLCDPSGFLFFANDNLGAFDMGDTVGLGPVAGQVRLQALVPIPAKLKLIRDGAVVEEKTDRVLSYEVRQPGAYRLEAWLSAGGHDWPWIVSSPIYVRGTAGIQLPPPVAASNVEVRADIPYTEGAPADEAKHKLDLYLPMNQPAKGKKGFPVLLFLHGGGWNSGDRSLYRALGARFASQGIAVAIPSYRLMPANPFPAQIEDVAAAFAWVYKNIAAAGGDPGRIYVSGHSAGGHLAALLALDPEYLTKLGIPAGAIRGVISMSGIYDVSQVAAFASYPNRAAASPAIYVHPNAPPFLITYCQWDYPGLPRQAREFSAALRKSFVGAQIMYLPGETHVSEIISAVRDASPLERAILNFIQ